MNMFDQIIILIRTCANFHTTNKTIAKFSTVNFGLDELEKRVEIFLCWYIEPGIPLTVDVMERNEAACGRHGKLRSEVAGRLVRLEEKG